MESFKVFLTGATGYTGGDALHLINESHPEWRISCLVRDSSKASNLISKYPHVRIVHGDLDSTDLIEEEAADANLIYHFANCDHKASAYAIARGVARSHFAPAYWIHTSGAGILTHQNFALQIFGSCPPVDKTYDDWDGVDELTRLPDKALHRHVDKIVLGASSGHHDQIKTAIVCPPAIYGQGRGTGNNQSVQVNVAVRVALQNGTGLQVGDGSSIWHGVHVQDLSQLYLILAEAAVSGESTATWNDAGYYLAENGAFTWGEIIQAIADESQKLGYLATNAVESVGFERAQQAHKLFPYLCGTTSKGISKRAKMLLGWKPQQKSLREELPSIIKVEAESLGLQASVKGDTPHIGNGMSSVTNTNTSDDVKRPLHC